MPNQPAIIFDLDGTLADTIRDLVPALNRTIAPHGLAPVTSQQVAHVCGNGIRAMVELAYELNEQELELQLADELFGIFLDDYTDNIAVETILFPGAEDSLQKFTADGWILGICSNKPIALVKKLLNELGIHQIFSSITGGDSFDFRKPDPRHLVNTIDDAGAHRSKAIMVGDSQTDILTAQNADIPVIAVDFGYSKIPVEKFKPDLVISNFDDLFDVATQLIK